MENKNGGFIMAKIIKRAGIVFLALVISLLLILGCMFAVNTATEDKNAELQNNDGNIQETAEKSYTLSGTCSQMAATWNEAVTYSRNNSSARVDVTLGGNWTAQSNSTYVTAFGTGAGFYEGKIYINDGINMVLDLNGYAINRNLSSQTNYSGVFYVNNAMFTLKDSYYTKDKAQTMDSVAKIQSTRIGKITGNYSNGTYATLECKNGAVCNIYGGVFYNNILSPYEEAYYGNAINVESATLNIYGALVAFNINNNYSSPTYYRSGVVLVGESANATFYDIIIKDNSGTAKFCGFLGNSMRAHTTRIGAGVQIYDNMDDNDEQKDFFDVFSQIIESLDKDGKTTYIGISMENYEDNKNFLADYGKYNSANPQKYFFIDKGSYAKNYIVSLKNGELTSDIKLKSNTYDFVYFEDGYRKNYKDNNINHGNDYNMLEKFGTTNAVLGNIMPNTSINTLINAINFDGSEVAIYDNKGKLVFNKGTAASGVDINNNIVNAVGTGWRLETYSDNNNKIETVYLSVFGDVNGDGRITASDVAYLRQLASDAALFDSLSMHKKIAVAITNKGGITRLDAEILRFVIDKIVSLEDYV